jgi:hypothetical protein
LQALAGLRDFVLVLGRTWFAEELGYLGMFLEPLFGLGIRQSGRGIVMDGDGHEDEEDGFSDGFVGSCGFTFDGDGKDWSGRLRSSSSRGSISSSEGEVTDSSPSPSPSAAVSLFSSPSSCSSSTSLAASLSKRYTSDITPSTYTTPATDMGKWELRLENQNYYTSELCKLEEDLQTRGINCRITAV